MNDQSDLEQFASADSGVEHHPADHESEDPDSEVHGTARFPSLPTDWEIKRLDEVATVQGGSTPSTDEDEYWGGDILWATPTDLTELQGNTISDTEDKITEAGLDSSSTHVLPPYSVLLTSRASIGKCAVNTVPMATNQGFQSLIPEEEVNTWYLYYVITEMASYLESLGAGSTFSEISKREVQRVQIPVPPMEEQLRIASILRNTDLCIKNIEDIISRIERLKREYVLKKVSGQDIDGPRKEGIIGTMRIDIPEAWDVVKVGDVADIVSGNSFPKKYQQGNNGPHPVIKVEDMNHPGNNKYINQVTNRVTEETLETLSKSKYPAKTVIHPRVGEALLLNKTRITSEEAAFDDNIMGWTPEEVNPEYLYYISTLIDFNSIAQTGTVPSINKTMAGSFRLPLPPEGKQEEIVSELSIVDARLDVHEKEAERVRQIRDGVMRDLIAGQIQTINTDIETIPEVDTNG